MCIRMCVHVCIIDIRSGCTVLCLQTSYIRIYVSVVIDHCMCLHYLCQYVSYHVLLSSDR